MRFTGLPRGGMRFTVDNENEIVSTEDGDDLYGCFNYVFLSLQSGDNELVFSGGGAVRFKGRCLYNVGA